MRGLFSRTLVYQSTAPWFPTVISCETKWKVEEKWPTCETKWKVEGKWPRVADMQLRAARAHCG